MKNIIWRQNGKDYIAVENNNEIYYVDGRSYARPIEIDGSVTLGVDEWGRHWKERPGILTPSNPLMFTCGFCGKTGGREFRHLPDCKHSYNTTVDNRWLSPPEDSL